MGLGRRYGRAERVFTDFDGGRDSVVLLAARVVKAIVEDDAKAPAWLGRGLVCCLKLIFRS